MFRDSLPTDTPLILPPKINPVTSLYILVTTVPSIVRLIDNKQYHENHKYISKRPWISVATYICLKNGDFAFRIRDNGAMMTSSILDNPETATNRSPHLIRPKCRFLFKMYKLITVLTKYSFCMLKISSRLS